MSKTVRCLTFAFLLICSLLSSGWAQSWEECYKRTISYLDLGQYAKGVEWGEKALKGVKKEKGKKHIKYLEVLGLLTEAYKLNKNYEEAIRTNEKCRDIIIEKWGKGPGNYGIALEQLGDIYLDMGDQEKTIMVYLKARKLYTGGTGPFIKLKYDLEIKLGNLYHANGEYVKAEGYYISALEGIRKAEVADPNTEVTTRIKLSENYIRMGYFHKAEETIKGVRTLPPKVPGGILRPNREFIISRLLVTQVYKNLGHGQSGVGMLRELVVSTKEIAGSDHFAYGNVMVLLGDAFYASGQIDSAIFYCERGIEILEREHKKNLIEVVPGWATLGMANLSKGNPEIAEPLLLKALEVARGTDLSSVIKHELGIVCIQTGRLLEAETYLEMAIEEYEMANKPFDPDYLILMKSYGDLCAELEKYEEASKHFLSALKEVENNMGKDTDLYAELASSLGGLYMIQEELSESSKWYFMAKSIYEKNGKDNYVNYYPVLMNLGTMAIWENDLQKSEEYYRICKKGIREKIGIQTLYYSLVLRNLSGLYYRKGENTRAVSLMDSSLAIFKTELQENFRFLSQSEKELFLLKQGRVMDRYYSYAYLLNESREDLAGECYNHALFQKGLLFRSGKLLRSAHLAKTDQETQRLYAEWRSERRVLGKAHTTPGHWTREETDSIAKRVTKLEKRLMQKSALFAKKLGAEVVNWRKVQEELPSGSAAVEFIHFDLIRPAVLTSSDSVLYVALVLKPGMQYPQLIPLFEQTDLQTLHPNRQGTNEHFVTQFYGTRSVRPTTSEKSAKMGEKAYELIWKPMEEILEGVETVYYSPSGLLHTIAFEALPYAKDQLLIDRFNLIRMGTTGTLRTGIKTLKSGDIKSASIFGGMEYDLSEAEMNLVANRYRKSNKAGVHAPRLRGERENAVRGVWRPLPGTQKEISRIRELVEGNGVLCQFFEGKNAVEEAFKSQETGTGKESPEILHIASHGFSLARQESGKESILGEGLLATMDDPLFRSGLVFSGANQAWEGKMNTPLLEDGILTAYEVSNLDLSTTDLVVLSACETGLGEIKGAEGVFGLQRAFKMAGVKFVIMSLWKIPDQETVEFMEVFYQNFVEGDEIRTAFNIAQKEMKDQYPDQPYLWAGFVLVE